VLGKGKVVSVSIYHVNTAYGAAGKIPYILNRGIKHFLVVITQLRHYWHPVARLVGQSILTV